MLPEKKMALGSNGPPRIAAQKTAIYCAKKGAAGLQGEESLKERLATGR